MANPQVPPRPTVSAMPNAMGFTYNGADYQIFIDVGQHEEAYRLAEKEDWEALSKWPKYTGQKHDYTEYNREHGTSFGDPSA